MTSPWSTEEGRVARWAQLRLLAEDKGFLGEFAREVVAGRTELHAILRLTVVPGDVLDEVRDAAQLWNVLPDEEKYVLTHEWEDNVRRTIEVLTTGKSDQG